MRSSSSAVSAIVPPECRCAVGSRPTFLSVLLGLDKSWGRIAKGYTANFVLLTANPLADISNTQKIDSVVLNGKLLKRTELDRMLHESRLSSSTAN